MRTLLTPEQHDAMSSILANYIAAAKLRGDNLDANAIVGNVVNVAEILLGKPLTDEDRASLVEFAKFLML